MLIYFTIINFIIASLFLSLLLKIICHVKQETVGTGKGVQLVERCLIGRQSGCEPINVQDDSEHMCRMVHVVLRFNSGI